jgi:ABC-type Fe3+/spermidine/putrescine transport system ATPase subunit
MFEVSNLTFSYDDVPVVREISFGITQGEHLALMGESGCGKSTLLKLLYGLHDPDQGRITYDGQPVLGPKYQLIPGHDQMKYLAQDFGLMPFATVAENVGHFLSNTDKPAKRKRVEELLELTGMLEFADVKPFRLSGGQQQRVALSRILALEPKVVLLDEPFSQIDTFRADTLRRNLFRYFRENGITCITATHDNRDVLAFADNLMVMKDGQSIVFGNPSAIYRAPDSKYVASLFDDVSVLPATALDPSADAPQKLFVYPHQLEVVPSSGFSATVKSCYFEGAHYRIEALTPHGKVYFLHAAPLPLSSLVALRLRL